MIKYLLHLTTAFVLQTSLTATASDAPCNYHITNITSRCFNATLQAAEIHYINEGNCSNTNSLESLELWSGANLPMVGQWMAQTPPTTAFAVDGQPRKHLVEIDQGHFFGILRCLSLWLPGCGNLSLDESLPIYIFEKLVLPDLVHPVLRRAQALPRVAAGARAPSGEGARVHAPLS